MSLHEHASQEPLISQSVIAVSPAMQLVMQQIQRAAKESVHVFVCGEPGTGRELIARKIHEQANNGAASSCPFVKLDCSRSASHDLEMALFGVLAETADAAGRSLERVARAGCVY